MAGLPPLAERRAAPLGARPTTRSCRWIEPLPLTSRVLIDPDEWQVVLACTGRTTEADVARRCELGPERLWVAVATLAGRGLLRVTTVDDQHNDGPTPPAERAGADLADVLAEAIATSQVDPPGPLSAGALSAGALSAGALSAGPLSGGPLSGGPLPAGTLARRPEVVAPPPTVPPTAAPVRPRPMLTPFERRMAKLEERARRAELRPTDTEVVPVDQARSSALLRLVRHLRDGDPPR